MKILLDVQDFQGKTTQARRFVPADSVNYFDLEDRPELFPIPRVLCDRDTLPARFLVLGCDG